MNTALFFPALLRSLRTVLLAMFWLGVVWLLLGSVISFVPGGEENWFALAELLLTAGLFLRRWAYRVASVILVTICVLASIDGHGHGIQYRHQIEQGRYPRP